MSQENVEIVKAAIDAYNREDWDALVDAAAPGFELDFSRAVGPWHGVFGRDQFRRVLSDISGGWESLRVEPHEFIEVGDVVVVPWTTYATGRDGIELTSSVTNVWTVRGGAIERVTMYQERQDALEAVGLSEQDAHAEP
jgi:ketosteroid isomerase-like protein